MRRFIITCLMVTMAFLFIIPNAFADEHKDTYLVKFNGPAVNGLLEKYDVPKEDRYKFDYLNLYALELTDKQLAQLEKHPHVEYVEENQESYQSNAQTVPYGIENVQAEKAYSYGYNGKGVKVAVLDTGIDRNHPDLRVVGGYSPYTYGTDANPFIDPNGHGTHVAGTIAALNNNIGVVGVASQADLYAVKVLKADGRGSFVDIAKGIEWSINNGMQVINMSLGSNSYSQAIHEMVDYAYYEKGIIIVAAAGNDGNGYGDTVDYPARHDSVIAVANVDQYNNRVRSSSTGNTVEISAPGYNVYSTMPGGTYASMTGTSMASPHVAGVYVLMRQQNPYLSAQELRNRVNNSAKYLGSWNWYGNGLVQAPAALGIK